MKLLNDYETLSEIQKLKWKEKQGNICYREWFDTLHDEYTLEEAGAILLALMFYDGTGGTQPLPKDLADMIDKDRATRSIFRTYMEKTAAGTRDWINKHKLKYTPDKEETKPAKSAVKANTEATEEDEDEEDDEEYIQYTLPTGEGALDYQMINILYVEENKENIPTEQELINTVECFNLEEVLNLVKMGNKDKWNSHYVEYLGVYEE